MKKIFLIISLMVCMTLPAMATVTRGGPELAWLGLSSTEVYKGLSTDTKPSTWLGKAVRSGAAFWETNTGKISVYTGSVWVSKQTRVVCALDTLTAPGYFLPVCSTGFTHATFLFCDSLVTTSATVQYRGKVANIAPIDWFNLDAENDTTQYVATTGSWSRTFTLAAGTDSLRQKVISEAGGTGGKFWSAIILWNQYK